MSILCMYMYTHTLETKKVKERERGREGGREERREGGRREGGREGERERERERREGPSHLRYALHYSDVIKLLQDTMYIKGVIIHWV